MAVGGSAPPVHACGCLCLSVRTKNIMSKLTKFSLKVGSNIRMSRTHLSSVLVAFVHDDGSVVRRRRGDSGACLAPQRRRRPHASSADHRQRHDVDDDEQKKEERATELSAVVDLVEAVGADESGDGAEVAVDGEGVSGGVEVRRRDDKGNNPRTDDDAARSSPTVGGAAVVRK